MLFTNLPRQTVRLPGSTRRRAIRPPPLRLTPYAWAKLLYLRDLGPTEVGGFGISSRENLMLIQDVCLVRQHGTQVTVAFEDQAVADFFDDQVDQGRSPAEFARIWVHTHPGSSAEPSGTDEATFQRCFGQADWALMVILAQGGKTYARLRLGQDPCASIRLPVELDFSQAFPAAAHQIWSAEFASNVQFDGPMDGELLAIEQTLSGSLETPHPRDLEAWDWRWLPDSHVGVSRDWEVAHG